MSEILTLKGVEKHLDRLFTMIVDLNICIKNAKIIHEYDKEGSSAAKSGFMVNHFEQLKFITVIQLFKVLSPSEKNSIPKLLNKLCNSKYDQDFKTLLQENAERGIDNFTSKKDIKDFKKIYDDDFQSYATDFDKVKDVRDKYYAHHDNTLPPGIGFDILEKLIVFCTEKYKTLAMQLLNSDKMVEEVGAWDVEIILKQLEKAKKLEMEKLGIS
jgi:hypothetical protein